MLRRFAPFLHYSGGVQAIAPPRAKNLRTLVFHEMRKPAPALNLPVAVGALEADASLRPRMSVFRMLRTVGQLQVFNPVVMLVAVMEGGCAKVSQPAQEVKLPFCFVIQPFDAGKFNKCYRDHFSPAIVAAGLEPYRVDHDPSVNVPIDQIEEGIRQATVCFADITTDNPNVWFELGYALASQKEVCLVCSVERQDKYPFDIQHRSIIRYRVDSSSDFEDLQSKITERLQSILERIETMEAVSAPSLLRETKGISQHKIVVLAAIFENQSGLTDLVHHSTLINQMERLGYNNLALNIGLARLIKQKMIVEDSDKRAFYRVSSPGIEWLSENSGLSNFMSPEKNRKVSQEKVESSDLDNDIPF